MVNIPSFSDYEVPIGVGGGDVSSAGTASAETGSTPPPDDALVDLSGSSYTFGPYDTFEAYTSGSDPTNYGYGWASAWEIRIPTSNNEIPLIIAVDDFSLYTSGSSAIGTYGGWGWKDATGGN